MTAEIPITAIVTDLPPEIPWDVVGIGAFGAAVVGVALYFSWRKRMVVSVSSSRTVIPPLDPRDDAPIFDESGHPIIGGFGQNILDAIHQLSRRIDHMSETVSQQIEAMTAQLTAAVQAAEASDAATKAALTEIAAKIAALPDAPTQAEMTALKAAVESVVAHAADDAAVTTQAQGIATGTGTATSTST